MTTSIEQALAFKPPPRDKIAGSDRLKKWYFDPVFHGLENISPDKPTLLVGNHTRFAALDMGLLMNGIYAETGVFVRGLADRMHYKIPYWRDMLAAQGAVLGSREMCSAMMEAGQTLLVFPGGGREVTKGRGTNYKLLWKGRTGFVRMAVQHGYSITPFSSVGADEALDVWLDTEQLLRRGLGDRLAGSKFVKALERGGVVHPVPRGIGLSFMPRPEKFYFRFDEPIETSEFSGRHEDQRLLNRLQRKTADAIYEMHSHSLLEREQEGDRQPLLRRIARRL